MARPKESYLSMRPLARKFATGRTVYKGGRTVPNLTGTNQYTSAAKLRLGRAADRWEKMVGMVPEEDKTKPMPKRKAGITRPMDTTGAVENPGQFANAAKKRVGMMRKVGK